MMPVDLEKHAAIAEQMVKKLDRNSIGVAAMCVFIARSLLYKPEESSYMAEGMALYRLGIIGEAANRDDERGAEVMANAFEQLSEMASDLAIQVRPSKGKLTTEELENLIGKVRH